MEQYQPTYPVRVTDEGRVEVDPANPSASRPRRVRPRTPRSGNEAAWAAADPLDF